MCKIRKKKFEFKNYLKQIPVPLKLYIDFEFNSKNVECYEGPYSKKYQDHVPCSFAYKLVYIHDKFTKPIFVFRGENFAYEFIKAIFIEYQCCKKIMKKHISKSLIMNEEKEQSQWSNICWICDVIPNALEKYMAFFLNKNLVFIDSMQFMNSGLDKLVKNR